MKTVLLSLLLMLSPAIANSQNRVKPLVIKLDYDGHLYIKCKINGTHEANLLFDTGANGLLLDEDYFKSTGIPIVRSQLSQLPGAGTTPQIITVVLDRTVVNLDTITFVPSYVPLLKLRPIVGEKADGIIGPDFLLPYYTKIDYIRQEMSLYTDKAVVKGFDSVKLETRSQRYYLPVEIKTKEGILIKGNAQLDLGSGGTFYMTSPTGKEYNLATKVENAVTYFNDNGGAGGRVEGYAFRASSITVGKNKLSLPDIDVSTDTAGALSKSEHIGLLGNSILERFDLILNFKTGMLYCKPNKRVNDKFVSNLTGFMYVNNSRSENALVINGLYRDSHAEKAGIKAQDKIMAINGVKVSQMSNKEIKDCFKREGKKLELTILSGTVEKKVTLVLKENI